jgi:hypothetical protein
MVKKAVVLAMEEKAVEAETWALLQETADKEPITSS